MLLTLLILLVADFAALEGLQSGHEWTIFWSYIWLVLLSLALALLGSLQALSWVAFESPWADTPARAEARAKRCSCWGGSGARQCWP